MKKFTWKYKDGYRNYYVATAVQGERKEDTEDFFYTVWKCTVGTEDNVQMSFQIETQLDINPSLLDVIRYYVQAVNSLGMEWLHDNPEPLEF